MIGRKNTILRRGEKVFLSCMGYKGFIYPAKKNTKLLFDVECRSLPWLSGGSSCKAVLVPENALRISGNPRKDIPVWVSHSK